MKKTFIILFMTVSILSFSQTVRRVNADVTVTGTNVYHTIQAAHDAAVNGDILIVEPGVTTGDLNCIKSLTIYGRGYFLNYNANYALLPNNSVASLVGNITVSANGLKVSGLSFGNLTVNGGVSGMTLTRNSFSFLTVNGTAGAPTTNINVMQNVFSYVSIGGVATGIVSNVTISNNQISAYYSVNNFTSNLLYNQNTVPGYFNGTIYNSVITNNIFLNGSLAITSSNAINTTFNNNILTGSSSISAAVGSNNNVVSNLTSQFQTNTSSSDNGYRVNAGSVLKTASLSGGEVGMFGGSAPYVQYGIPPAPSVIKLFNTGLGNATTPITATISASSNN